jgi:hypothetical protein
VKNHTRLRNTRHAAALPRPLLFPALQLLLYPAPTRPQHTPAHHLQACQVSLQLHRRLQAPGQTTLSLTHPPLPHCLRARTPLPIRPSNQHFQCSQGTPMSTSFPLPTWAPSTIHIPFPRPFRSQRLTVRHLLLTSCKNHLGAVRTASPLPRMLRAHRFLLPTTLSAHAPAAWAAIGIRQVPVSTLHAWASAMATRGPVAMALVELDKARTLNSKALAVKASDWDLAWMPRW